MGNIRYTLGAAAGLSSSAGYTVGQANCGTRYFRSVGAMEPPCRCRLLTPAIPADSQPVKYRYAAAMPARTRAEVTTSAQLQLVRDWRRCSSVTVP